MKQAIAAKRAADRAETAYDRAEHATRASERAYLGIDPDKITITFDIGRPLEVSFEVRNFGRTPATITAISTFGHYFAFRDGGPFLPVPEQMWTARDEIGCAQIEAGHYQVRRSQRRQPMTDNQMARVKTLEVFYGIGAKVEYLDVFGSPHTMAFAAGYDYPDRRFKIIADGRYNYAN